MDHENYPNFYDTEGEDAPFKELKKENVINHYDEELETDPFKVDFNQTPFQEDEVIPQDEKPLLTEEDLDIIINYDENKRKDEQFTPNFAPNVKSKRTEPDNLYKKFNDFLVFPKISGDKRFNHTSRLPSEIVSTKGDTVEVSDAAFKTRKKQHSSVIVNREPNGEVDSIEVICTCGERTLIKFDFADAEKDEHDFSLTEVFDEKPDAPISIIDTSDELDKLGNIQYLFTQTNSTHKHIEIDEESRELLFKEQEIGVELKATMDRLLENNSVSLFTVY